MKKEPKNLKEWIQLYTDKYDHLSNQEILNKKSLKLYDLNIKEISFFLNDFYGTLNLSNNQIKEIPANFNQNGTLYLNYNKIKEIPANFKQNGDLYLNDNKIEKIHSPKLLNKKTLSIIIYNHKRYIERRNKKDSFISSLINH